MMFVLCTVPCSQLLEAEISLHQLSKGMYLVCLRRTSTSIYLIHYQCSTVVYQNILFPMFYTSKHNNNCSYSTLVHKSFSLCRYTYCTVLVHTLLTIGLLRLDYCTFTSLGYYIPVQGYQGWAQHAVGWTTPSTYQYQSMSSTVSSLAYLPSTWCTCEQILAGVLAEYQHWHFASFGETSIMTPDIGILLVHRPVYRAPA